MQGVRCQLQLGLKMSKSISKFLSLVLRHKPQTIGLTLDKAGWANVDELIQCLAEHGTTVGKEEIERIVATNEKKRYVLSEDGTRIKAAQGHSLDVKLQLKRETPPFTLYHGTVEKAIAAIRREGLSKMNRHHVHRSKDKATATNGGSRRGAPIILEIAARKMHDEGHQFFLSENGVWLVDAVPPGFIVFP